MVSQDIRVCAGGKKYNHISVSFDTRGQWKLFKKHLALLSLISWDFYFFLNVTH